MQIELVQALLIHPQAECDDKDVTVLKNPRILDEARPNRSLVTWQIQYQPGGSSRSPMYLPRLSRDSQIFISC